MPQACRTDLLMLLAAVISEAVGLSPEKAKLAGGVALVRAMQEPLRQIVTNAGEEGSVVLNKVRDGKGNYGYNAATGEYTDMIEAGILDPTKVVRSALQNAALERGFFLSMRFPAPTEVKLQQTGLRHLLMPIMMSI